MKQRSIALTFNIRYWTSVLYYICMLIYGVTTIGMFGLKDIGFINSIIIVSSFFLGTMCILVKMESVLEAADPLNKINKHRYRIILFLEATEILIVYGLANIYPPNYIYITAYSVYITIIYFICRRLHKKAISNYNKIRNTSKFDEILKDYLNSIDQDINIDLFYKGFINFTYYIIGLIFIYKFTLYNWGLTTVFIVFNIYVLFKLHWNGIKMLEKHSKIYFCIICISSTLGIVLLKLIYDGVLYVSLFQGRDKQELLMVLILFYLPLSYYGKKLSKYINRNYKWVA